MEFKASKITSGNTIVGRELRAARLKKNLKIEEAAGQLSISIKYVKAIESGRFEILPAGLYQKKLIREYAGFLGIDIEPMLGEICQNGSFQNNPEQKIFYRKTIKNGSLILPQIFRNLAVLCVVTVCFVYLLNKFENIFKPPTLEIAYPTENLITDDHSIDIKGWTEAETQIMINGNQVLSDAGGNFNKTVNLRSGINTITIKARKKFGNEVTVVKQVLVKE